MFRYQTPYSPKIEEMAFPADFKHPNLKKFNGDGSPEEHMMHFIIMIRNFSRVPRYCLRLFRSSLTEKPFRWYSALISGYIHTWEQMQSIFLENFFSSDREVSLTELASAHQQEDESVDKFISRWRTLGASCSQLAREEEQVKLCIECIKQSITLGLTGSNIQTFQDLIIKACNSERIKVKLLNSCMNRLFQNLKRATTDIDKEEKKTKSYESTTKKVKKEYGQFKNYGKYTIEEDDILPIMNQLLAAEKTKLPLPKHLKEMKQIRE